METAVYRGHSVTVLIARPADGGEAIALVCEDAEELRSYERLFRAERPHILDHRTPLRRSLQKHYPTFVLETLSPPITGGSWPWIVAFYSPKRVPDGQRGHWVFEVAGDEHEAQSIVLDINQQIGHLVRWVR